MRLSTGQTIGRYVIESLLGEGGMGEVYRARDSKLERVVALKVLRNDTEGASEDWEHAVMRMQREAQAVAALSHPGIVAIYDIGEHEGSPFIAMEFVRGLPLRALIGTETPMRTRIRILLDVARALGAAHEAGFVHRDIKPENILVREDGVPKVLDFGIARRTSLKVDATMQTLDAQGATVDAALTGLTADGALVGTPAYMAPEQLRGEPVDARADQFAWGVVAHELLSGKHPFQTEKGAMGLFASILSDAAPPLSGIPDGIAAIVMRALEKDPEQRWPSMHEIVAQCEAFVTHGDTRKVPVGHRPEGEVSLSQTGNVTPVMPRRAWVRWRNLAPILGIVALGAVAFGLREHLAPAAAPVALPSAAPTPPTMATAVTDLPIPASNSVEATAAFRGGLQAIRDARWGAAAMAFHRARTADPGMAAAHLRYSVIQFSFDVTTSRDAYRTALGLRSSLSERDQGFLQAVEPIIQRAPADYDEATRRFESLSSRYLGDAELTYWHARTLFARDTLADTMRRVIELNERCVELDPRHADCWQLKAKALYMSGRLDQAVAALDECVKVSENGVDCLLDKIQIDSDLGNCDVVIESSRRLQAREPFAPRASTILAESLYISGKPEPLVRAAFEDAERRAREAERHFDARSTLFQMDLAFGELPAALDHLHFMTRSMTLPNPSTTIGLHLLRAELSLEMDKLADAAVVADEYFIEHALHASNRPTVQVDPTVYMHSVRLRAGKLSHKEYEKLRAEWVAKQNPATDFDRAIVWVAAFALPAFSSDLAKDATNNASNLLRAPLPDSNMLAKPLALFQGRIHALAGRHDEALPFLEKASRICMTTDTPLSYLQNIALLGIAREATGDKPGACKAFRQVLSRWGKSKQSKTVKVVTNRAKKLGCERSSGT